MKKIEVDKNLFRWINCWAAEKTYPRDKEFLQGYNQACSDIYVKIKSKDAYPLGDEDNPNWGTEAFDE